jgi:hypothetical protein
MGERDSMTTVCGAPKKRGGHCARPAGWGTGHVGVGACKYHGGAFPNAETAGARDLLTREGIRLGVSVDMGPMDLMLQTVRHAAGSLQWATQRLADGDGEPDERDTRLYDEAVMRAARVSKMALDAKIAERQVQIAQRTGALIATAFDRSLEAVGISPAQRSQLVRVFEGHLLALEQSAESEAIEGTAA